MATANKETPTKTQLYARMRETRALADRNAFVEVYLPLCEHCVMEALGAGQEESMLWDECLGACSLALVEAAETLMTMDDPVANVSIYLSGAFHNAITRAMTEEQGAVRVPLSTVVFRANYTGDEDLDPLPNCEPLPDEKTIVRTGQPAKAVTSDELLEEILACCKNAQERALIRHLAAGETPEQAAVLLDVCVASVYGWRQQVRERYESRNDVRLPRDKRGLAKVETKQEENHVAIAA